MSETQDVSSAMDSAAQAAGAGDFLSAERELRRAFALQEAALGPAHPDLANTLNNLGVVSERLDRPAEAERCYRRAYAIASAVLQPDHPFVVMSAKNLRDFCDARGIPFELTQAVSSSPSGSDAPPRASWPPVRKVDPPASPSPAAASVKTTPVPRPAPSRPAAPSDRERTPAPPASPEPSSISPRTIAIAAVVLGAIIVAALWTMRSSPAPRAETASSSAPATSPSASSSATSPAASPAPTEPAPLQAAPAPPAPAPVEQPKATPPAAAAPVDPQPAERKPPAPQPKQTRATSPAPGVSATVVSAQLCRPLTTSGNWSCTPASDQVAPGVVFFYTRVTCPADTSIEHRWYLNDRLHQSVTLRVRANSGSGYRTYSRTTIGAERAGNWRVELRAADGTVLHEERFSVAR